MPLDWLSGGGLTLRRGKNHTGNFGLATNLSLFFLERFCILCCVPPKKNLAGNEYLGVKRAQFTLYVEGDVKKVTIQANPHGLGGWNVLDEYGGCKGYGARIGGSLSNSVNLILRLFLYNFLHTMSSWCHESIHNNTNNQHTSPPWWWSCLPLQRCGFYESTPPEWRAALRIYCPRPPTKDFVIFI